MGLNNSKDNIEPETMMRLKDTNRLMEVCYMLAKQGFDVRCTSPDCSRLYIPTKGNALYSAHNAGMLGDDLHFDTYQPPGTQKKSYDDLKWNEFQKLASADANVKTISGPTSNERNFYY